MVEITSEEQNKVKGMKRTEDSLRDLWDNIKHTNIQIIGVPEEEKKKGYEKIFEESTVENFPSMEKEVVNQVQEAQTIPYRIKPRRKRPTQILIKLTKTEYKERILKAAMEKQQVTYKENTICLTADLSAETLKARREWQGMFNVLKGKKIYNQNYFIQQRSHSKLNRNEKLFRQAKVKRIQDHQISFTTNLKDLYNQETQEEKKDL